LFHFISSLSFTSVFVQRKTSFGNILIKTFSVIRRPSCFLTLVIVSGIMANVSNLASAAASVGSTMCLVLARGGRCVHCRFTHQEDLAMLAHVVDNHLMSSVTVNSIPNQNYCGLCQFTFDGDEDVRQHMAKVHLDKLSILASVDMSDVAQQYLMAGPIERPSNEEPPKSPSKSPNQGVTKTPPERSTPRGRGRGRGRGGHQAYGVRDNFQAGDGQGTDQDGKSSEEIEEKFPLENESPTNKEARSSSPEILAEVTGNVEGVKPNPKKKGSRGRGRPPSRRGRGGRGRNAKVATHDQQDAALEEDNNLVVVSNQKENDGEEGEYPDPPPKRKRGRPKKVVKLQSDEPSLEADKPSLTPNDLKENEEDPDKGHGEQDHGEQDQGEQDQGEQSEDPEMEEDL
jgi:hypothetical protein